MMVLYSKLIGAPVAELKDQTKVGEISDFIIENAGLTLAGAIISQDNFLFSKKKVISSIDFIQLLKKGVIIGDENAIAELSEIGKLETLYKNKNYGIGQKVITKSGQYVGHVFDYLIDAPTLAIRKFYIKKLFNERIIPVTSVISFEGKIITIKEDKGFSYANPVMENALTN